MRRMPTPPRQPSPAQAKPMAAPEPVTMKTHEIVAKTAPDISEMVERNMLRVVEQEEDHIRGIPDLPDEHRRTFPETLFRENFLPIVSGSAFKKLPEGYTPERLINEATDMWSRVAGGLNAEVDVIEPDGRVAFTFPPLVNTNVLNTRVNNKDPLLSVLVENYQKKVVGLPTFAEPALQAGLTSKLTRLFKAAEPTKRDTDNVKNMRQYYGLKESESPDEVKVTADKSTDLGELSFD